MPSIGRIIKYGLLLYAIWFVAQIILSMVYGVESVTNIVSANLIAAVVVAAAAWWLGRRLNLGTRQVAMKVGALWAAISLIVLGALFLARQTESNVFGVWSVYLTFVGIFIGTVLSVRSQAARPASPPPTR